MKLLRLLLIFLFFIGCLVTKAQNTSKYSLSKAPQQSAVPTTGVIVVPVAVIEKDNLVAETVYSWQVSHLKGNELTTFVEKFKKEPLVKSISIIKEESSGAILNFSFNEAITLKNCLALFTANGINFFQKENSSIIRPLVH